MNNNARPTQKWVPILNDFKGQFRQSEKCTRNHKSKSTLNAPFYLFLDVRLYGLCFDRTEILSNFNGLKPQESMEQIGQKSP